MNMKLNRIGNLIPHGDSMLDNLEKALYFAH